MKGIVTMMVRVVALGLLSLIGVAVLIGRASSGGTTWRILDEDAPVFLSRSMNPMFGSETFYLDRQTGQIERYGLPRGESFRLTSVSPWRDERGSRQVASLWFGWRGSASDLTSTASGLARATFPGGRVLDRIETEYPPNSPPCWYPGTTARVLYAGADGRLYSARFEDETGGRLSNEQRRPAAVALKAPRLAGKSVILSDPCWPTEDRLGGRVLVSLNLLAAPGQPTLTTTSIWWLQLDATGMVVVDAGQVTPDLPSGEDVDELSPTVMAGPGGELLLAYLTRPNARTEYRLHVRPIRIDSDSGAPWVEANEGRLLCDGLRPDPPIFTSDGRWVGCSVPGEQGIPNLVRFSVADFVPSTVAEARPIAAGAHPKAPVVARINLDPPGSS